MPLNSSSESTTESSRSEQITELANRIFRAISDAEAYGFVLKAARINSRGVSLDLEDADYGLSEPVWYVKAKDAS